MLGFFFWGGGGEYRRTRRKTLRASREPTNWTYNDTGPELNAPERPSFCTQWTLRQILSVTLWFIYSFTDDVLPPGMHVRGDGERKQSSSNKLIVGLVVTFIILLLIAIGIIGFLLYRRKRRHQFEYKKQVLYSDDKAEEFEIFTWRLTNFPFIPASSTCLKVVWLIIIIWSFSLRGK